MTRHKPVVPEKLLKINFQVMDFFKKKVGIYLKR